jgi:hypothetical protein
MQYRGSAELGERFSPVTGPTVPRWSSLTRLGPNSRFPVPYPKAAPSAVTPDLRYAKPVLAPPFFSLAQPFIFLSYSPVFYPSQPFTPNQIKKPFHDPV